MMAFSPGRSHVLIVDDSPGVLLAMEKLLSAYLSVQVADGASAALQALTPETALVLADVRMPDIDGLELARTLKQTRPDLPVVLMTGIVEDSLRAQARQIGVLEVLRKPIRAETLLPALQEWLHTEFDLPELEPDSAPHHAPPAVTATPAPATPAPTPPAAAAAPHPLMPLLAGLNFLPGMIMTAAYDLNGDLLEGQPSNAAQIGGYVRYLTSSTTTLAQHLHADGQVRAVQLEFCDRVLVICPASSGYLTALVRDTSAASSVKAWLRTHLHDVQHTKLN